MKSALMVKPTTLDVVTNQLADERSARQRRRRIVLELRDALALSVICLAVVAVAVLAVALPVIFTR